MCDWHKDWCMKNVTDKAFGHFKKLNCFAKHSGLKY